MSTADCPECPSDAEATARLERIYGYLDGALNDGDLAEVREHLGDCPECASDYTFEQEIRTAVKRSCSEQAPETLKATILERINDMTRR